MSIITISRGTFSGGVKLAQRVAEELNYTCIGREEIVDQASKYGASESALKDVLSKAPTFWDRFTSQKKQYLILLKTAILEKAVNNNVVYHGHAGHLLLGDSSSILKVKLLANMLYRIEEAIKANNFTKDDAVQYIYKMDNERQKWTKFLYNANWNDPHLYDIVINLKAIDVENATNVIKSLAMSKKFKENENTNKLIKNFYLASKVAMALSLDKSTSALNVIVKPHSEAGVVELMGTLDINKFREKIIDVASKVDGIKKVNDRMSNPL